MEKYNLNWCTILCLILLIINIVGTFIICFKCAQIKKLGLQEKNITLANLLTRGIALVEVLFLLQIHASVINNYQVACSDFNIVLTLKLLCNVFKSLFFSTILCYTSHWLDLKKITYKTSVRAHE